MIVVLLAVLGCADSRLQAEVTPDFIPPTDDPDQRLFLEVTPINDTEPDGRPRAFPAFVPDPLAMDDIIVELQRPFLLEGILEGLELEPTARATLPTNPGPIQAIVHLRTPSLAATQRARTDSEGFFNAPVIVADYTVTVVPDHPTAPLTSFAMTLDDQDPDLPIDLDQGVPLYGRVLRGGTPLAGSPVQVLTVTGIEGATAITNEDGWYEIRAAPGDYVLHSYGLDNGVDPIVVKPVRAGTQGHREDFALVDAVPLTVAGRVFDLRGNPLRQVPFRLRATDLPDFGDSAMSAVTGFTDNSGNLFTRAVAGTYVLEVFAENGLQLSSRRIDSLEVQEAVELGTIELTDFRRISGTNRDSNASVPGSVITCTELGFLERTWSSVADDAGRWTVDVPTTAISCAATPPFDRPDLALTRFQPALDESVFNVAFLPGALVSGTVRFEGEPEVFALVEVRDGAGRLWGSTLSDGEGVFALRVAIP